MITKPCLLLILLTIACMGCTKAKDTRDFSGGLSANPLAVRVNVITAGQSNMSDHVNNMAHALPTYLGDAFRARGYAVTQVDLAVSGSPQTDWAPGSDNYNRMIDAATTKLGYVNVLFWWQGEAEAMYGNAHDAEQWGQRFTAMIRQFRADIHQPTLQVIFCQIGTNPGTYENGNGVFTSWNEVQHQQEEVYLTDVSMVRTQDQNFHGFVHTDDQGYRTIANRLLTSYLNAEIY